MNVCEWYPIVDTQGRDGRPRVVRGPHCLQPATCDDGRRCEAHEGLVTGDDVREARELKSRRN